MATRLRLHNPRRHDIPETVHCHHGLIYPVGGSTMGAIFKLSAAILPLLKRIEDVTVVAVERGYVNVLFPLLRMPEVVTVMRPLGGRVGGAATTVTLARAPAARRGRLA